MDHSLVPRDSFIVVSKTGLDITYVTLYLFLILTTASVSLRFYTRILISHNLGADDWIMLFAWVLFVVNFGIGITLSNYQRDLRNGTAQISRAPQIIEIYWLERFFYIASVALTRLSVGTFLLRVAAQKTHRILIWGSIFGNAIFNFAFLMYAVFECTPVTYYWTRVLSYNPNAHCKSGFAITIFATIVNGGIDLFYALIPIAILWHTTLSRRLKITLAVILGIGSLPFVTLMVRAAYIKELSDLLAATFADGHAVTLGILAETEIGTGIVAGSLATLRPLAVKWKRSFDPVFSWLTQIARSITKKNTDPTGSVQYVPESTRDKPEASEHAGEPMDGLTFGAMEEATNNAVTMNELENTSKILETQITRTSQEDLRPPPALTSLANNYGGNRLSHITSFGSEVSEMTSLTDNASQRGGGLTSFVDNSKKGERTSFVDNTERDGLTSITDNTETRPGNSFRNSFRTSFIGNIQRGRLESFAENDNEGGMNSYVDSDRESESLNSFGEGGGAWGTSGGEHSERRGVRDSMIKDFGK